MFDAQIDEIAGQDWRRWTCGDPRDMWATLYHRSQRNGLTCLGRVRPVLSPSAAVAS